jgi:hypothetical protein
VVSPVTSCRCQIGPLVSHECGLVVLSYGSESLAGAEICERSKWREVSVDTHLIIKLLAHSCCMMRWVMSTLTAVSLTLNVLACQASFCSLLVDSAGHGWVVATAIVHVESWKRRFTRNLITWATSPLVYEL